MDINEINKGKHEACTEIIKGARAVLIDAIQRKIVAHTPHLIGLVDQNVRIRTKLCHSVQLRENVIDAREYGTGKRMQGVYEEVETDDLLSLLAALNEIEEPKEVTQ